MYSMCTKYVRVDYYLAKHDYLQYRAHFLGRKYYIVRPYVRSDFFLTRTLELHKDHLAIVSFLILPWRAR